MLNKYLLYRITNTVHAMRLSNLTFIPHIFETVLVGSIRSVALLTTSRVLKEPIISGKPYLLP